MKENQARLLKVLKNRECKQIQYQYQYSAAQRFQYFSSPKFQDLYLQKLAKVGKPFTQGVQQLIKNLNQHAIHGQEYANCRGFLEDEVSIPKSFKISCTGIYRSKCQASFYYVFDEEQRFYYLEYAQNLHYHSYDHKKIINPKKIKKNKKAESSEQQLRNRIQSRMKYDRRRKAMQQRQLSKRQQQSDKNQEEQSESDKSDQMDSDFDKGNIFQEKQDQ